MDRGTVVALSVAGLLLIVEGVGACPLQLSHSRVVLKYGDPVSVSCTTSESEFEGIGWEAKKGGTSLTRDKTINWTVESLTVWEAAPLCYFNPSSEMEKQCNVSLDVVLYTFPQSIDIVSTDNSDGVVTLAEEHNLTCIIHNVAPVEHVHLIWFKNEKLYSIQTSSSTNLSKKPSNMTSTLGIKASREDNRAVYRCEAHLDLTPFGPHRMAEKEYTIKVNYGPDVNCSGSEVMVQEGTALGDVCTVTGNPINSVQWLKNGEEVNQSIPLTRDKGGTYTLKAEGHMSIEKNFEMKILYGPELTCKDNQTVVENAPFNLSCIVQGFPQPDLTFYMKEEEVELPDKLTRKDEGLYVIHASNSQKTVQSGINITVIYPPSRVSDLEDTVVKVGSDVLLKCASSGNPRPQYAWRYRNASNVCVKHEDGVTFLSITNATVDNSGLYACDAWNRIGRVTKNATVIVEGVYQDCPIEITPNRMVVQYQSKGKQATCTSAIRSRDLVRYHWEDQQVIKYIQPDWPVITYERFDVKPYCVAKSLDGLSECRKQLDITVYKPPDSVSINRLSNSSPVVKDKEFQLQCNITNVAPVRKLAVRWYQDNHIFEPLNKGTMHVTNCHRENEPPCDISLIDEPENVLFTINHTVTREQSGALFHCEPLLDLGPDGPQPPVQIKSRPLNLTVHYKPTINVTKLPETIPVFNGYPEELVCEADGNPQPVIVWHRNATGEPCGFESKLTVSEEGSYSCHASNTVGSVTRQVKVILKEDYLPLIAGFVALVVIIISVIFAFIYSIYYKNTKMRHYSLKNVKLNNTHNGNVAHNGWESQFPMTRLS